MATTTTTTKSGDVERSYSNYSIKLRPAGDDVTDDVIDDVTDDVIADDDETKARLVLLSRSDQLGFGFSAAGERPTTIRSVIKGMPVHTASCRQLSRQPSQTSGNFIAQEI